MHYPSSIVSFSKKLIFKATTFAKICSSQAPSNDWLTYFALQLIDRSIFNPEPDIEISKMVHIIVFSLILRIILIVFDIDHSIPLQRRRLESGHRAI